MENRIAIVSIIVENSESTREINRLLHENADFIIGRMGIPHRARGLSIISVVLDAPMDVTGAMAGKLGMLSGVSVKTLYSKENA